MFSGAMPTTYLQGSLDLVQFPTWFSLIQRQKNADRHLIELETHCSLKTLTINRNEFNLDYLPILSYLFDYYLKKQNIDACLTLMNSYYLNQDDIKLISSLTTYRKMSENKTEVDIKTKTLLKKSLEKQYHRTPFKQIDINKIKPGMTGARDDDDDYTMSISDDDDNDKENMIIDNDIIRRIKRNPKRQRKE